MKTLPDDVARYATTPEFTEATAPQNLLENHQTGTGVWGKIVVFEGRLRYHILGAAPEEHELSPDAPGIIEPTVPHLVEPIGPVRFQVEFYR